MNFTKRNFQIRLTLFTIFLLMFVSRAIGQTTLTTAGPVGSALITDDYGVVSNFTVGTASTPINWVEYSTSFVILDNGSPLEVSNVNATEWDNNPAEPFANGFFIPGQYQDWTYDVASTNVWHNTLEFESGAIHIIGTIGYKIIDPSPTLGSNFVDWTPAYQFTNVAGTSVTIEPFRYTRIPAASANATYYSNHGSNNDYDQVDGTSDDFVISFYDVSSQFLVNSGFSLSHYQLHAYTVPTDLYTALSNGGAGFDLSDATATIGAAQPEVGFQYETVTLASDQAVLYWLYPKPIIVNCSASGHPTDIDWDDSNITASDLNSDVSFTDTDVSINFSALTYPNTNTECKMTVVEITGGMIESSVNGPLSHVSDIRYWEIFYDTRRSTSTASITFSYDPATDEITDENTLSLAYRTDYDQNWTVWNNITRDAGANTITAQNVQIGDAHWVLASTGDNPLPVELSSFALAYQNYVVNLEWRTETESSNWGFDIYRKHVPDKSYKKIGWVKGAGTTSNPKTYMYIDKSIKSGETYFYYLESIDTDGSCQKSHTIRIQTNENNTAVSLDFQLLQNFPNPFNAGTWLPFKASMNEIIAINIYDITGRLIRELPGTEGQAVYWDGTDLNGKMVSSGVYYYRLAGDKSTDIRKMVLLK